MVARQKILYQKPGNRNFSILNPITEEEEDLLIRRMGVRMIDTTDASDVSDDKKGDY